MDEHSLEAGFDITTISCAQFDTLLYKHENTGEYFILDDAGNAKLLEKSDKRLIEYIDAQKTMKPVDLYFMNKNNEKMENFFYEDRFVSDLSELMDIFDFNEENINEELEDGWSCVVEETDLEPIFQVDAKYIAEIIYNANYERYTEDGNEDDRIIKALKESIDFDKLNAMIPRLYYPNNKTATITKQDLIDYVKN